MYQQNLSYETSISIPSTEDINDKRNDLSNETLTQVSFSKIIKGTFIEMKESNKLRK